MNAKIITIGDEILIGQIVDTNSARIADMLTQIGITVKEIISISDDEDGIVKSIDTAQQEADLIVLTGGLGPTNDDRTKYALIRYFETKLVRHQPTYDKVVQFLTSRGIPILDINAQQADMPENCTILENKAGSVPGMLFRKNNKIIVSVPGVPFEMKYIISKELIPYLKENYALPQIIHKTFLTVGVGESVLAERLKGFEESLPENYSLAYLPSPGKVRLRLSAYGEKDTNLSLGFPEVENNLLLLLEEDLFGYNTDTMEAIVGRLLAENNYTLSTAESCTGGDIANKITSVPGASGYFKGTVVSYANEVKKGILKVSESSLAKYGAVSKEVVTQMAENVRKELCTDFGLATSGIAGPSGGTEDKPVGMVWIALASESKTIARKFNFGEHRGRTIDRSTLTALNILRLEIQKIVNKKQEVNAGY